jgi:hypothetical protein
MNVLVQEDYAINNQTWRSPPLNTVTTIIPMQTFIPSYQSENILYPHFCNKFSKKNFILCLEKKKKKKLVLIARKNCLLNHRFSPHLLPAHSK